MAYPSVFDSSTTTNILDRLEKLTADSQPQWGTMNASQMLAHLNVAYDMTYGKIKVNNSAFKKWLLKLFIKKVVTGEQAYSKNSRTAPEFIIKGDQNFEKEKTQFIAYVKRVEADGLASFDGRDNVSFGPMSAKEWSNLFYKHLDHHFNQFGL